MELTTRMLVAPAPWALSRVQPRPGLDLVVAVEFFFLPHPARTRRFHLVHPAHLVRADFDTLTALGQWASSPYDRLASGASRHIVYTTPTSTRPPFFHALIAPVVKRRKCEQGRSRTVLRHKSASPPGAAPASCQQPYSGIPAVVGSVGWKKGKRALESSRPSRIPRPTPFPSD